MFCVPPRTTTTRQVVVNYYYKTTILTATRPSSHDEDGQGVVSRLSSPTYGTTLTKPLSNNLPFCIYEWMYIKCSIHQSTKTKRVVVAVAGVVVTYEKKRIKKMLR